MAKTSPNATLTTKSALDLATVALQDLPEKPKEKVSLREAVELLQTEIVDALGKGYSYEEIAEVLSKEGIPIASSSLKHYLARSKRQAKAAGTGTGRKQRSTTSKSAPAPDEVEASKTVRTRQMKPAAEPVVKPAAKTRTTSRTSASKKAESAPVTRQRRGRAV